MAVDSTQGVTVVYVVDDDDAVRDGFARLLRSAGLDPRPYGSPELFLDEVRDDPRACVLLDVTMPGMSGLEVQASLNDRHIGLPVIMVSARDDSDIRRRTHSLGARMFLHKPVDDQALLDAINWVTRINYRG